jgi:hypothetical protein
MQYMVGVGEDGGSVPSDRVVGRRPVVIRGMYRRHSNYWLLRVCIIGIPHS